MEPLLYQTSPLLGRLYLQGLHPLPGRTEPLSSVLQQLVFFEQPETKFYWGDAREEGKQVNNRDHRFQAGHTEPREVI